MCLDYNPLYLIEQEKPPLKYSQKDLLQAYLDLKNIEEFLYPYQSTITWNEMSNYYQTLYPIWGEHQFQFVCLLKNLICRMSISTIEFYILTQNIIFYVFDFYHLMDLSVHSMTLTFYLRHGFALI